MNQTALVTGASSGIGRALAQQFAAHGYDVVLVARNGNALEDVGRTLESVGRGLSALPAGGPDKGRSMSVRVITADLSRAGSGSALVEQLRRDKIQVDVLVNNAGFGLQGPMADLPLDRQIEMIQLNVVTLTELTRVLLPEMLSRRAGGVLNVASTAAFQPGPLMSVYYATKAYVLSFTEGIAEEVAGTGVKVTCLCPGPTETQFANRAGMTGTQLFKGAVMNVDDVAREGFDGWHSGQTLVVPGFSNRRGIMAVRLFPRALVRRIVKRLNSTATG